MKMSVAKEKKKDVGVTWKTDDPDDCEKEINSLLEDKIEIDAILKHPHLDIRLVNSVNTFIQKKKRTRISNGLDFPRSGHLFSYLERP